MLLSYIYISCPTLMQFHKLNSTPTLFMPWCYSACSLTTDLMSQRTTDSLVRIKMLPVCAIPLGLSTAPSKSSAYWQPAFKYGLLTRALVLAYVYRHWKRRNSGRYDSPKYLAELRGPKARVQPERRLCCRICRMAESNCLPLHRRFCNVSMLSA